MKLALTTIIIVTMIGCSDVTQPDRYSQKSEVAATRRVLTFDDKFVQADNDIPGFAGLYIAEDGSLVANVSLDADVAAANAGVAKLLGVLRPGQPNDALLASLRVERVKYSFKQLRAWYDAIAPTILSLNGVTFGDVDERNNELTFGVDADGPQTVIVSIAKEASIPTDAVKIVFDLRRGHMVSDTLDRRVRPIVGGVAFQSTANATPCTIGFNATHGDPPLTDTNEYFITVSHCTPQFGVVDNLLYAAQPTTGSNDTISVAEVADPALFTHSSVSQCPINRWCRYSDAAVLRYSTSSWAHALVAWPPALSLVFSSSKLVIGLGDAVYGETLYKVGRTTGKTSGVVSQTCADYQVNDINGNDTGMTLLCQGIAGFNPSLGDSGAPVVRMEVLDYVTAVGILNYSTGGFSMMNAIQQEINYAYCPLSSCRP